MPHRVVHFEIQADDLKRARGFYTKVFDWRIEQWEGGEVEYWMVMTAEKDSDEMGINGGLVQRELPKAEKQRAANAFVCTLQVEDYDAIAARIVEAGGRELVAKTAIAGMAWQGYFMDTEGNIFGIHQPDEDAA